ncbi:MAG: HEAT repeat domain-containing protein [Nitrospira sp.]|nr:HEAT repeat domain-containing protein [Nitrospira sp.]
MKVLKTRQLYQWPARSLRIIPASHVKREGGGIEGRRRRLIWRLGVLIGLLNIIAIFSMPVMSVAVAVTELQRLYERQEYQKVIDEIAKLGATQANDPQIRRLKIRSLLRMGHSKEAMTDYDQFRRNLKQDDLPLLREISLGFLLVMANDMREHMRGVAHTALKDWQSPESIPFLEDGLKDRSGFIRALAAEGLAKLDKGRNSARLREALDDPAALVKEAALKGLAKSGDASVVNLVEPLLEDPEGRVRVAAAEVLCRLRLERGCMLVQQSAKSLNPDERKAAIRALVELQSEHILTILIEASEHQQPSVRGAAAMGLAHVPKPEAVPILTKLLRDPLPPVRVAAAVSLGQLPPHLQARLPLKQALAEEPEPSVKAFVIGGLLEQGEESEALSDSIAALSTHKESAVRAALARALGRASKGNRIQVRSTLESLLVDPIPRVRIAALKSIAKLYGKESLPFLKEGLLYDEDDAVRATAGGELLRLVPMANS